MRFRVLIISTPSQKADFHISRFFRELLIPYYLIYSLFIIIGFLHKFIYHRNKHIKADVLSLIPGFSILTDQIDFKQVRTFIQYNPDFSGVLEPIDLEFNAAPYYFQCFNLNSLGHQNREIGFQDGPDIPGQFQIVVLISFHDYLFFHSYFLRIYPLHPHTRTTGNHHISFYNPPVSDRENW